MSNSRDRFPFYSGRRQSIPTRHDLGAGYCGFQGLTLTVPDLGVVPYFTAAFAWFSPAQRAAVYPQLRAAGVDTLELDVSGQYVESPYRYPVPGQDWTGNLPGYAAIADEAIGEGFKICYTLSGDGQSVGGGPDWPYNDPNGWTRGAQWLVQALPGILSALGPARLAYGFLRPGYDGVWYGWTVDQIRAFSVQARALMPGTVVCVDGSVRPVVTLAIEFSAGLCHLGNGKADYQLGGALNDPTGGYDLIQQEFRYPIYPDNPDDLCQVGARELGPYYRRPSWQLPDDDPGSPFPAGSDKDYMSDDTPRGPWLRWAIEDGESQWVRGLVTADALADDTARIRAAGYSTVG